MSNPPSDHVVPECRCPSCGHTFDRADSFSGPHRPRPGDISICINCRSLNVFAMDLTVREPTDHELIAVAGDPKIRAMTNAIARVPRPPDSDAGPRPQARTSKVGCE